MGITAGNLGYPRIGANREWKKALEAFWAGRLEEQAFTEEMKQIRLGHLRLQREKGIDWIPVGDFSFYDSMLDMASMFGVVPKRFGYEGGKVPLQTYFAMARGNETAAACEMTKWFNMNYHYIVPELKEVKPQLSENRPLAAYREAKQELGIEGKPVMIGLYTFIKLSKGYESGRIGEIIEDFLPLYIQVLQELSREGAAWVQIDEPVLVTSLQREELKWIQAIYSKIGQAVPGLNIMLQTYFDDVEFYEELLALPVKGIGLDFVHGSGRNLQSLQTSGFPQDKVLGAGVVDGRNIWRSDVAAKLLLMEQISEAVAPERLVLQPSCSLLHVPVTTKSEAELPADLTAAMAFADEKLEEVVQLSRAAQDAALADRLATESAQVLGRLNANPSRHRATVREETARFALLHSARSSSFAVRQDAQRRKWNLPFLPTTTIGSFPQTKEVRAARQKWRKGEWTDAGYTAFLHEQIQIWIEQQEQIGLDVLVHGEFERTDMVEYFGEKLGGFAFTTNGWVQSYGSRCVKPPVIYGDVEFLEPMTVAESMFAQSLTLKPVKGMLTGPVTILNWSFVRDDLPRSQTANQIALALRKEVEALEAAGVGMIQVDEPALREGLPLKKSEWQHYLDWAVNAFRLAVATVKDETQIHTHMCYCEFHDIIDSIRALDADVISIETSRSHGELIHSFEEHTYNQGIGLGVYDIHSPRVPSVEEMEAMIDRALQVLDPSLFWINPDCGLKTRGMAETAAALRNMVEATRRARQKRAAVK